MKIRFTVGQLAKLSGISKQTLIYYDRQGVFCPKQVDPNNGYRYYTPDQLEVLDSVLLLREMGLSLKEIKLHMSHRTAGRTMELLKEQQAAVQQKIDHWSTIFCRLDQKIQTLQSLKSGKTAPFLQQLAPAWLLYEPVGGDNTLLDLDIALKRLFARAAGQGVPHNYQIGSMLTAKSVCGGQYLHYCGAFLPLSHQVSQGAHLKSGGLYACMYHQGEYATVGQTYQMMLGKIKDLGYVPVDFCYEYSVLDSLTNQNPTDYLTQIQIKVTKQQ